MGKIFCIIGKSGSGKDTIKNSLMEIINQNYDFKEIIQCTTRPKRDGETDGKEYHFVTPELMREDDSHNDIFELRSYDTVDGTWYYYTRNSDIDIYENNYITIGTIESFRTLSLHFGKNRVIPIYIYTSSKQRLEWMIERESRNLVSNYKEVCRRYIADEDDFTDEKLHKAGIDDDHMYYNEDGYALFLTDTLFHKVILYEMGLES